ncbi:MFS transporter [Limibacter armeniacum]|uniref:MFS transporter n=1 Tax=Limibacter armeniacum TaxID=466084 RepID=UPI002FE510C6
MERIAKEQKHGSTTFLFALARAINNGAYYGLRGVLVLYMVSYTLALPEDEALSIYLVFTLGVLFSKAVGGILGDFVLGNRMAYLTGALLQAIGCFVLCISGFDSLYIGLVLIALGNGLFGTNALSEFGKLYYGKEKLSDAGFTILNFISNIGIVIGTILVGYAADLDYSIGFAVAGVVTAISGLILFFSNIPANTKRQYAIGETVPNNKGYLYIGISTVAIFLFWFFYELGYSDLFELGYLISEALRMPEMLVIEINNSLSTYASVGLAVFWSFFYVKTQRKLALGMLFGSIAFAFYFIDSYANIVLSILQYGGISIFLVLAELFLFPIICSTAVYYVKPKYLSTVMGLAILPSLLAAHLANLIPFEALETNHYKVGAFITMLLIGILVLFLSKGNKKNELI